MYSIIKDAMKAEATNSNGHFGMLQGDGLEFLLSRIEMYPSQENEMISSEWKEYLRIKCTEEFSPKRLDNLADPSFGLTYGLYGGTTNDKITLSHKLYQRETIYQELIQIKEPDIGNPPKKFSVQNQRVSGNFLRQVYFVYQLLKGISKSPNIILEIGGGYGLSVYIWKVLFPQCKIMIVDVPETILLQYSFLSKALQNVSMGHVSAPSDKGGKIDIGNLCDITFVECNSLELLDISPDMVLALACFQEMTAKVVDYYVSWVEENIARDGFFFMYNCYGMDPTSYQSPAQVQLDNKWRINHLQQATLIENDNRHLEIILQRSDRANLQWDQKKTLLNKYYDALQHCNNEQMDYFSGRILNE